MSHDGGLDPAPRQLGVPVHAALHVTYMCVHVCAPTLACMCLPSSSYSYTWKQLFPHL